VREGAKTEKARRADLHFTTLFDVPCQYGILRAASAINFVDSYHDMIHQSIEERAQAKHRFHFDHELPKNLTKLANYKSDRGLA